MKRARPEAALQRAVAQYLDAALDPSVVWCHIPNERSSRIEAFRLKAEGVKAGVPDILIWWLEGYGLDGLVRCGAGAIELKAPKRYPSKVQRVWAERFKYAGGFYYLCRSIDEVEFALQQWGVPLRISKGGRTR